MVMNLSIDSFEVFLANDNRINIVSEFARMTMTEQYFFIEYKFFISEKYSKDFYARLYL